MPAIPPPLIVKAVPNTQDETGACCRSMVCDHANPNEVKKQLGQIRKWNQRTCSQMKAMGAASYKSLSLPGTQKEATYVELVSGASRHARGCSRGLTLYTDSTTRKSKVTRLRMKRTTRRENDSIRLAEILIPRSSRDMSNRCLRQRWWNYK